MICRCKVLTPPKNVCIMEEIKGGNSDSSRKEDLGMNSTCKSIYKKIKIGVIFG